VVDVPTPDRVRAVVDLARIGAVHVEVERYTQDEAREAYRRLHDGKVRGRAVVVPGTANPRGRQTFTSPRSSEPSSRRKSPDSSSDGR
jgi:hypothetical protein